MPISQLTRNIPGLPTKALNEGARLLRERGGVVMNPSIGEPTYKAPISAFFGAADCHEIGRVIHRGVVNGQIIDRGIQSLGYAKLEHMNINEGLFQPASHPEYITPISIDFLAGEHILPESRIGETVWGTGFYKPSLTIAGPAVAIAMAGR